MTSKAARRRRRKPPIKDITLPGGETARNRRDRRGHRAIEGETDQQAMRVALTARAARIGTGSTEDADLIAARAPWLSSDMGRAIAYGRSVDETAQLWQTWCAILDSGIRYRTRIIGMTGFPRNAALAVLPDKMQADVSHSVDMRTAEEKDRHAKAAAAYWEGLISDLPTPPHKGAIRHAICQDDAGASPLWADRTITDTGRAAVSALVLIDRAARKSHK